MEKKNQLQNANRKSNSDKVYLPDNVWKLSNNHEEISAAYNFRQKMECPVCYLVRNPISHMCPLGHVICFKCYKYLVKVTETRSCPLCRSRPIKLSTEAKLFNKTYKFSQVTCRYYDAGCRILIYLSNVQQHEAHCIYKPVFCIYPGCTWTDTFWNKLHEHVLKEHPEVTFKTSASFGLYIYILIKILHSKQSQ